MLRFVLLSALVAAAFAEPPAQNYGAPSGSSSVSNQYGAPSGSSSGGYNNGGSNGGYSGNNGANAGGYAGANAGGDSGATGFGGVLSGGMTTNIRQGGAIESERDLELENEGLLLPSDIVGQDLLDRVVDALSEELAQQEAARAATSSAYGVPNSGYGAPSSGYGAPGRDGGANAGRIQLLIPPDPLKAKLIANYIQRTTGDYVGGQLQQNSNSGGGYDSGANNGGYSGGNAGGYSSNSNNAGNNNAGGYSGSNSGASNGGYQQGGYQG